MISLPNLVVIVVALGLILALVLWGLAKLRRLSEGTLDKSESRVEALERQVEELKEAVQARDRV